MKMKNILVGPNRATLARFAASNTLLGLDFDGTLAPIVTNPKEARMSARTRNLLQRVSALYPVVVISGRARADVSRRVRPVSLQGVVGNHGAETGALRRADVVRVQRWLRILRVQLARWSGVVIEPKRFSVAIHYRQARYRPEARTAILRAAAAHTDARVVGGKLVVNLLVPGSPHKGEALERERKRLRCTTAMYVGDDDTDEDVFRLVDPRLLGIRVGASRRSAARYCIRQQVFIDDLLRILIDLRSPRGVLTR